jgi:hypothetical protein
MKAKAKTNPWPATRSTRRRGEASQKGQTQGRSGRCEAPRTCDEIDTPTCVRRGPKSQTQLVRKVRRAKRKVARKKHTAGATTCRRPERV